MSAADDFDDSIYVERGNFEQVPDDLWRGGAVSPRAVVLYLSLAKRGSREARGVPKRATLARDMGVSLRTVDAALDELIQTGWLLITPRWRVDADHGQTSNHYTLLWTQIVDAADPRLIRHQRAVEEFEQTMSERSAANAERDGRAVGQRSTRRTTWLPEKAEKAVAARTSATLSTAPTTKSAGQTPVQDSARGGAQDSARGEREILHGGSAESCTGGAQDSAPQEGDLSSTRPSSNQTDSLRESGDDAIDDDEVPGEPVLRFSNARQLPDDFAVTARMRKWFAAQDLANLGVDGPGETEQFLDYHRSRGDRMKDWEAAWRTWMRNAAKYAARGSVTRLRQPAPSNVLRSGEDTSSRLAGYFDTPHPQHG